MEVQDHLETAEGRGQSVWRSMSLFLVPLLLSNVLQSVGQLVGMVFVGRWLGVDALAAVSSFFPLFFLLISFTIGIGSGSSILIGQAYGAKNEERMKAIVGTTLTFTFMLGVVLAVVGSVFTLDILRLMGTPENVIDVSVRYARILFCAMPLMFLYFAYTTFLRGTGDSKTPFYTLIVSTVINIGLLPLLILGLFGLPKFGIYGSAYATVISNIVTFIVLMVYLRKRKHPLAFDRTALRSLKMDKKLLALLLRLGIPSSINMILVSLSEIAVISFVNHYGSNATAAYGVVNQVASYVQMPAVSLGIAVSIFAAQSIGANQFGRQILALFLTDQDTLHIARNLIMITLWSYLIFGHAQIVSATMRASGTVLWPTIISIFAIWGIEVPVAFILSHYTNLGILGIWVGYPAAFVVSLLLQYGYYRFVWKKKQITRLIQ